MSMKESKVLLVVNKGAATPCQKLQMGGIYGVVEENFSYLLFIV